jgi:hypothetical protein
MTSRCAHRWLVIDAQSEVMRRSRGHPVAGDQDDAAGRFIWQLVGVLETYGSICLIGTKV